MFSKIVSISQSKKPVSLQDSEREFVSTLSFISKLSIKEDKKRALLEKFQSTWSRNLDLIAAKVASEARIANLERKIIETESRFNSQLGSIKQLLLLQKDVRSSAEPGALPVAALSKWFSTAQSAQDEKMRLMRESCDKREVALLAGVKSRQTDMETRLKREIASVDSSVSKVISSTEELQSIMKTTTTGLGTMLPVGTIVAWHKNLVSPLQLPGTWIECNGQAINCDGSILNGKTAPDLNSKGLFLRGSDASGVEQEDAIKRHRHLEGSNSENGFGKTQSVTSSGRRNTGGDDFWVVRFHTDYAGGTETRPINMSVVWIMRVL